MLNTLKVDNEISSKKTVSISTGPNRSQHLDFTSINYTSTLYILK